MTELNKKLAEWAGLKVRLIDTPTGKPEMWWVVSMSEYTNLGWIDFTESLDACFKWLVPKIPSIDYVELKLRDRGWLARIRGFGLQEISPYSETPALALCLAIEKLINSEVKDGTG